MMTLRRSSRNSGFLEADMRLAIALSLKESSARPGHQDTPAAAAREGDQLIKHKLPSKVYSRRRRKRGQPLQAEGGSSIEDAAAETKGKDEEDEPEDSKEEFTSTRNVHELYDKELTSTEQAEDVHKKKAPSKRTTKKRSARSRTPVSTKRKRVKKDAVRSHFGFAEPETRDDSCAEKEREEGNVYLTVEDGEHSCPEGEAQNKRHVKFAYPSRDDPDAVEFNRLDLQCLEEAEYVNDTVVDLYIKYTLVSLSKPQQQIHVFNSFFFKKLTSAVCDESSEGLGKLRKWIKGVDIFQKTYLLIPIHDRLHWSLAIICFFGPKPACHILHLDSMKTGHESRIVYEVLRRYLVAEWTSRGGVKEDLKKHHVKKVKVPQQKNEYDCGVFMLHFIEKFLSNAPPVFSDDAPKLMSDWFSLLEASQLRASIRTTLEGLLPSQGGDEHAQQQAHKVEATNGDVQRDAGKTGDVEQEELEQPIKGESTQKAEEVETKVEEQMGAEASHQQQGDDAENKTEACHQQQQGEDVKNKTEEAETKP